MASTASLSPWTTLNTPSGRPASLSHFASSSEAEGSRSDGFRMKQLPAASATGNIHIGTMAGKLNGVMPATTPSGWRREWLSTRVPTFSVTSPFSNCGAAVANSTTSAPRWISPLASDSTLPCSEVMTAASSSVRASRMPRNLLRMRARRNGGVDAQAGKAFLATAMASFTSAVEASDTDAVCSPVAGLKTGAVRPFPATSWPPMKKGMVLAMGSPPELMARYALLNSAQQWTGLRFRCA